MHSHAPKVENKPLVLIAAVLKPVDDIRLFHKLAKAIVSSGKYQVLVAAKGGGYVSSAEGITTTTLFSGRRNNWTSRMMAGFRLWKLVQLHQPEVLVISTVELIWVGILYKRVRPSAQLIYDVQENYGANVLLTSTYPAWLRKSLATAITTLESWASDYLRCTWLAEACYERELTHLAAPVVLLPNLALRLPLPPDSYQLRHLPSDRPIRLLHYGTLGEHYGTLDLLNWLEALDDFGRPAMLELIIAGYAASPSFAKKLRARVTELTQQGLSISLIGIEELVPVQELQYQIQQADVIALPYQPNASTASRIPTKLYEAILAGKPIWSTPNPTWTATANPYNAMVPMSFTNLDHAKTDIMEAMKHGYYGRAVPGDELCWLSVADTLSISLD